MSGENQLGNTDYSISPNMDTNSEQTTTQKSYSSVLSTLQFPSKEQAIIFPALEDSKLQDYLIPLGTIIEPKNILFSSRLSNQRICMYLKNKEIVDKFMANHGTIEVGGQCVRARRLITPAERLVLSNVSPTIPHEILKNELQKLNLNLVSPITFLKINSHLPEYSHILSFRRQVFISSHTISLPESVIITYEDTPYRIFLSQDMICYNCKKHGHIASKCTETLLPEQVEKSSPKQTEFLTVQTIPASEKPQTPPNIPTTKEPQTKTPPSNTGKRPVNEILSPPTDHPITSENDLFIKPSNNGKTKKFRSDKPNIDLLIPAKIVIENHSPQVLNFEQIVSLFDNIHGSSDAISIVKEYTDNFVGLLNLLESIYPNLTERSIKTRCTKLKKKLYSIISNSAADSESDTSSQDYY